ncbi:MAG TPA: alpha-1,4-glucan--maltose-1-phosphate maltosyltransferase [Kofleriaceae bacterium]|nr:alpha-1,4-glucan--maltose-1-phosphate maltosyltransferase [Kofleriaceae bacterium]
MSTDANPTRRLSDAHRRRAVVLAVRPVVDGGRYPAKRALGEPLVVEADIVADGHDAIRAVVLDRAPGAEAWRETELVHAANDAWRATIELPALGRHHYTVVAWVDAFATWRHGLVRKVAAGVDVGLELLEGALLVEAARARGGDASLERWARALRGQGPSPGAGAAYASEASAMPAMTARIAAATDAGLAAAMARAPDKSHATRFDHVLEVVVERRLAACSAWYELFPRSTRSDGKHGTLRDTEARLDYVAELGFDVLYLPPIHPIGRAFRKGPDNTPNAGPDDPGSPWAIGGPEGGHTSVHPALGTLADFDHLVAAARQRGLELALDIAFQASPDHPWVREHPSWFKSRPDGSIQYAENPPKKYQDVYPFDFESTDWQALWQALRDVFVFWCERGVRVFRVDNPHTKPIRFWEWCLAEVQARYPDAMFLAEAFTRPKLMYALAKSGFSQSYTYFTWRTTKADLEAYATEVATSAVADYFRPSFWPTTPDIFPEHLVHGGRPAFAMRLVLAGTLAASYGIYGPSYELGEREPRPGVEELARNEKYQIRTWDLDRHDSLRHMIGRLNRVRRAHPALHGNRSLRFHATDNELVTCYSKHTPDHSDILLMVVNLDPHHVHRAWLTLDLAALGLTADDSFQVHDLLGDARYTWRGARNFVELVPDQAPAHIFEVRRFVRSENQFEYFL